MPSPAYMYLRRRLAGVTPRTRLGQFTLYLLVVALALYLIRAVMVWLNPLPTTGATISGWLNLLIFLVGVLALVLLYRWIKRTVLWRLRNRLIVTYVFIGVVPLVLVVAMVLLAGYVFAGQFATFVATSDLRTELRTVEITNQAVSSELQHHVTSGEKLPQSLPALQVFSAADERFARTTVTAWIGEREVMLQRGVVETHPLLRPEWAKEQFGGVVVDSDRLYLRAVTRVSLGRDVLTVVSSMPLDQSLLEKVAAGLGRVSVSSVEVGLASSDEPRAAGEGQSPRVRARLKRQQGAVVQLQTEGGPRTQTLPVIAGGEVPSPRGFWDWQVSFPTPLAIRFWEDGDASDVPLVVVTRPSALYGRLFLTLGRIANIVIFALILIAAIFAILEVLALLVGLRLTRTITGSVAKLYEATERINRGDLRHRISVTSNDQLAALETSFNSMSESLQRLIAEQKEKERLQSELAIAQEVQAQLFPKENIQLPTLEIHGLCLPARTVSGDYYDFLPFGDGRLGMAVGDISGKGISAALLMATLHSAVRAYALENVGALVGQPVAAGNGGAPHHGNGGGTGMDSPAALLSLLNRHLFLTTSSEKYATLFLAVYDDHSRTFTYSNAGHLAPIVISADGSLRRLDQGGMVIGLFDNITHDEHSMHMRPGELLVAFSDGITEPENEFGEFGEQRLIEIVHAHRDQPLARVSDAVIAAVQDWVGPSEQPDDVTLVLARGR